MSKTEPAVLTIDDDSEFNLILERSLKKLGLEVETTETPEVFLKRLKETMPDVLIIDLNLDKYYGAGFKLIQAIRNRLNSNPVIIVMSRRSSREDISYALEIGADDYVVKPYDEILFISKLKQLIKIRTGDHGLPFYKVPFNMSRADFDFSLKVMEIDEFGIKAYSPHFIAKGSRIKLEGEIIYQLQGSYESMILAIEDSWPLSGKGNVEGHVVVMEFDQENEKLMSKIRKFLMNSSIEEEE